MVSGRMTDMPSYFEQWTNRQKPNRAQRRKKEQEKARRARRATRAWQRQQDAASAREPETKGDED